MGKGTRDLETRMRRRRVYASFDDAVVASFEVATMCSLGKDRGHWPDGLLISLTLITQLRTAMSTGGSQPTVNDVAGAYLGHMLEECRVRATAQSNTGAVQ